MVWCIRNDRRCCLVYVHTTPKDQENIQRSTSTKKSYGWQIYTGTETSMNPTQTQRRDDIVRLYRKHELSLAQISEIYNVTQQRISQIIKDFEKQKNVEFPHKRRPKQRVLWKCEQCKEERFVIRSFKAKKCAKCERSDPTKYIPDDIIEEWIQQRRNGNSWKDISRNCGYSDNNHKSVPFTVYSYLRRKGRLDEVKVIWKGYSTRWMARYFPKDAHILSKNKADGRRSTTDICHDT